MNRKIVVILAVSVFIISSLNLFATELIVEQNEQQNEKKVILQLDSTLAWVDGVEYTLSSQPKVIEGKTYLPLRFMADMLLEANLDWDPASKTIIMNKDDKKVQVTIDSKATYINGERFDIEDSPILSDNSTYLPVRAISNLFDIRTDYNQANRQVTLIKALDSDILKPSIVKEPIAQFDFEKEEYIAGQVVKAIDSSFHENGNNITNKLWMINFNDKITNSKLEKMFSKPIAGSYLVSLKVEAGKGNWSEWTTKEITIKPNQKPVITSLVPTQTEYAGGESIDFAYTYDNETWEGIKSVRWTYRQGGESTSKSVVEKPKHIFHSGRYIVTLQLEDDYGNMSDAVETTINVNEDSWQTELEYRFTQGNPGDIIDNFDNFNYNNYDTIRPEKESFKEGMLFISNSPENIRQNGVLYRDVIRGNGRIMLHHNNKFTEEENTNEPKKLVLVAENTSDKQVSLTVSNRVDKGPSNDVLFVGAGLLYDYLKGAPEKTYHIKPGEKAYIYDSGSKKWGEGYIIASQMDFSVNGELTLTAASIAMTDTIDDVNNLPILDKDVHPRGTFNNTDIYYKVTVDDEKPSKISLGSREDEWSTGYDALTGNYAENRGNYAVNYHIEISAKEDTGILINPRAGLFRGAAKWSDEEAFLAPSKGYIMGGISKGIMLGVVKAGETRTLQYSLPNGSSSPVLLVFMPKDDWKH